MSPESHVERMLIRLMTFPKDRLQDAQALFSKLGFQSQHPRIYHYTETIGNFWYTISVGLEDFDDQLFEPNITVTQRPQPKTKLAKASGLQMKVVPEENLPTALHEKLQELEDGIDALN